MLTGQQRREARQQAQEAAGELLKTGRPGAVRATQVTRQLITLAFEAGLNPELDPPAESRRAPDPARLPQR
jgi:hypothetical protein